MSSLRIKKFINFCFKARDADDAAASGAVDAGITVEGSHCLTEDNGGLVTCKTRQGNF